MNAFICVTCGTQFPASNEPPDECPICLDERQYVGHDGQRWTTMVELAADHRNRIEELEPGLLGIGTEPSFAIGQRALLVDGLTASRCSTTKRRPRSSRQEASTRSRSPTRTTTRR